MKTMNIRLNGIVKEALGNGLFSVTVQNAGGEMEVKCRCKGKMNVHNIRVLPGDNVEIEVSPFDFSKGFIVYRSK